MSKKLNSSPNKGQYQINVRTQYLEENSIDVDADEYLDFLQSYEQQLAERELTEEWQKNNLEYDLRSTDWIIEKAKNNEAYAQNLYAAMCNNRFIQPDNIWDILKEDYWSCSWRHAGGIIADILETGDYIDWYCSGINPGGDFDGTIPGYVSEGVVTDEVRDDLSKLGWIIIKDDNI